MEHLASTWRRDFRWRVLWAVGILAGCSSNASSASSGDASEKDGSADDSGITVTVYPCPTIVALSAAPSSIDADGAAQVTVATMVPDGGALLWTASSGSFADASATATVYWCAMPGSATLTATVTYELCNASQSVAVECLTW
jgi:hypothetical protein